MLTGADGAPTRPGLAETPLGNLWGVAAAMGAWFVPIGAMRHVAVVWWVPVPPPYPQGHTMYENTPFSGLRTVIDKRFAGAGSIHRAATRALRVPKVRLSSYVETCTSQVFCPVPQYV